MLLVFFVLVCFFAAAFTVLNGLRDAASAIAVTVRTRALTPTVAVLLAALFNLVGVLLSGTFALSLQDNLFSLHPDTGGLAILLAALVSALLWGLHQWWIGYPSSSTHALIGGIAGASLAAVIKGSPPLDGLGSTVLNLVVLPLLISPLIAFGLSYLLVFPIAWLSRYAQPNNIDQRFRRAQSVAASAVAFGHGLQDGSRIVALMLFALAALGASDPGASVWWLVLVVGVLMTAGTLIGGWRIGYTLAHRLVRVDPMRGLVAQSVSAAMLFAGGFGFQLPLATTQLTTAAVVGAGINQRFSVSNVPLGGKIALFWLLTPVACALLGGVFYLALSPLL
ncbi:PiT family inorganic phosphate transporter [Psychromicrobium silvestre]|uniref:PiT family inorganic phosphate transporter n=1 Tax=Psychromicrobium silvestre TaxID=1645614 RepID=A0A7Y9LUZ9_9MICC|nr:inorganic phosphate transporter [Psychromicrobium silvestre]NYE96091.1 PiT family inorganic phosphate transporter [Psychromicrobium silvestre]